jgi:arylsulfate sulfotransferase
MSSGLYYSIVCCIGILVVAVCAVGCLNKGSVAIENISAGKTDDKNPLRVCIQFSCSKGEGAYVEYWVKGGEDKVMMSPVSGVFEVSGLSSVAASGISSDSTKTSDCRIVLTNLQFKTAYQYRVVVVNRGRKIKSDVFSFSTQDVPDQFDGLYRVSTAGNIDLPAGFKKGCMLVYNRLTPGFIGMLDYQGRLRWCQHIRNTGVKVAHFTQNKTILAILAPMDYPTSYGNEILELSLTGDTVFHLKKGKGDFKETIHHEILLNAHNQYVTLYADERVIDLSRAGGGQADTVRGDGILVLDRTGKKVWSWNVFDELNPLRERSILKEAKDWMHANSLFIDADGNYIISFYNNGQIWKINALTKKVMWKFGRGGDFTLHSGVSFDQGHAVHMNDQHKLMLFDNGTSRGRSQILAFDVNETTRQAFLHLSVQLPAGVFTDRMGSAYLVDDSSILTCVSKQNTVLLTGINGEVLWRMNCANTPYRVEFIPFEKSMPYIGEQE